jgi:hypothetical protein
MGKSNPMKRGAHYQFWPFFDSQRGNSSSASFKNM